MRLYGVILGLFLSSWAHSQSALIDVLSAPITDEEFIIVQQQQTYLADHRFNSPWLRELEFRFRADNELNLDEYRMRLGLINPLEIRANKLYKQQLDRVKAGERKAIINDVLERRYLLIVEYYYLASSVTLNDLLLEEMRAQQDLLIQSDPRLDEIIDLEENALKTESLLLELTGKKQLIEENFQQLIGFVPEISSETEIIAPEVIMSSVNAVNSGSFYADMKKLELDLEKRELGIQKAEAFSNIGFVQGDYNVGQEDTFGEHFGFQLGLTLPIFNTDRPELQRRTLELIDEQVEFETANRKSQTKITDVKIELKSVYQQYQLIVSKWPELDNWKSINEKLSADQETYLKIAEFEHMLKTRSLKHHADMLVKYLDLLHMEGVLVESPLTNKLSSDSEVFEIKQTSGNEP